VVYCSGKSKFLSNVGPPMPEARNRTIDDISLELLDRFIIQPQAFHDSRSVIFQHDISLLD